MAFLDGVFNRTPAPAPIAPAPGMQPGNSATAPQNPDPSGAQPVQQNNAAAQVKPANSALDALQALMTPSPAVIAARAEAAKNTPVGVLPVVTQDQINQSLANADFLNTVPADIMQKATAGDPVAFAAVINAAVRAGVASNLQMSHTLVEQGVKAGTDRFGASLDSRFADIQRRNHTPENPALQHPMARQMVQNFAKQIANANPNLTPQESLQQAEQNFLEMNKEIAGHATAATVQDTQKNAAPEHNWLNYLDTPQAQA